MSEISGLVSDYHAWLKDKTVLNQLRDWTKITTPFLDRHNDYIEIYVRRTGDEFELTDDGHTLQDLEMSGCKLDTAHRRALLNLTLNGFGVSQELDALKTHSTKQSFPLKKHSLVQAMLAVNDLFVVASPLTRNLFLDDVRQWLDENEIRYIPNTSFQGVSGFTQTFDFAIPKSKLAAERLLKVVSNPTRDKAQSLAFAWHDTRDVRPANSAAYAMLNDSERPVSDTVLDALKAYSIVPIRWTFRNDDLRGLAA